MLLRMLSTVLELELVTVDFVWFGRLTATLT
jgi:hypothetical protein